MIQRYEAYMDGVALSSIDNSIVITDISHKAASVSLKTNKTANRNGAKITSKYFDAASVAVTFMIREQNTIKRQEICQKIALWATKEGYLSTYDRRWQILKCVCEGIPAIDSAKNCYDELSIEFKGYNPPFWQEENATKVTLGGTNGATSGSTTAYIPGNVKETLLNVKVTAKVSISSFSVTANGKTLSFSGLSLSNGDVVNIDYDDMLNLRIKKGSTSLMDKRTAASADELLVDCGKANSFSFTSSGNAVVEFTARGWWY